MLTIGFVGRAKSGKTTATDAIQQRVTNLGLRSQIFDIGQEIQKYCTMEKLIPDKPRQELTTAELDILVQTGFQKRQEDPNFWVSKINYTIIRDVPDIALVPNVRYPNEIDLIRNLKGVLVFVKSLNPNGSEFISRDRDPNHPSESQLDERDADFFLTAKRSQPGLVEAQAVTLFEYLMKRMVV